MGFLSHWTLQRKFVLFILLVILLDIGVFAFLSLQALGQSTRTMLQERLTIARLVAGYEDEVLRRALQELQNNAGRIDLATLPSQMEVEATVLEETYSRMGLKVVDILLLDTQGVALWEKTPDSQAAGQNFSGYDGISDTLQQGEPRVSGLISAVVSPIPVIFLSSLARDGGVLVVAIDPAQSSVGGLIQPIKLGETGYAEIVDGKGLVLARTEPGRAPALFEESDHPKKFAALIEAGKATMGTCHRCHTGERQQRDVLAFAPLPSSQASWGIAVRQSEEEALAPTRALEKRLVVAGMLILAISTGFAWWLASDMVSRIRMLKRASLKMAAGDLSTSIPPAGKDEIGTLAGTLDATREKLKASREETEQRSKELSSLLTVSRTFASFSDPAALLDAVVAKAVAVIEGADAGALLLRQPERSGFVVYSITGMNTPFPSVVGEEKGGGTERDVVKWALPEGTGEEIRNQAEEGCQSFIQSVGQQYRSAVCAPLVSQGRCTGNIILVSLKEEAFAPFHLHLLRAIANEVALVVENIELSKEAEEARVLRETDKLKSQFISAVSHELRTPLTSIKGYATSLLRQDVSWSPETQREFLQTIDEKSSELQELIDKMFQIAKVEAGALNIKREPVLLPHLARRAVAEAELRSPKHQFVVDFPSPFPVVEADGYYVEVILRNLVDNAVKYSPKGGQVVIRGERKNGEVMVKVKDEGMGIAVEHQERIFDRFYRVEGEVTRRTSGSGLGLSIVKGLVEAHGGRVGIESTSGKGSTFFFTLPLSQGEGVTEV